MNFVNSFSNLISVISNSSTENILIVVLILTESFLVYFNLKILKLVGNINGVEENVDKNFHMLKNVL